METKIRKDLTLLLGSKDPFERRSIEYCQIGPKPRTDLIHLTMYGMLERKNYQV